jgi:ADP-ribose pyrophosphatase YjhB (NUDIX family)
MPFWLETAKRIQALAQAGLAYTTNEYDRERYEELQRIGFAMLQEYSDTPVEKIQQLFAGETGYPTPKVDIRAVVIRANTILMVQEKSDRRWALPGGWADIGYSPKEIAVKEVKEEAGLSVRPVRLLAVYDKMKHDHPPSPFHVYKIFILCEDDGDSPEPGMETIDAGFFPADQLPPLSVERNTEKQILTMFDLSADLKGSTLFD